MANLKTLSFKSFAILKHAEKGEYPPTVVFKRHMNTAETFILVRDLEKNGLIKQVYPMGKRPYFIRITPKGKDILHFHKLFLAEIEKL